jgi:natural product precursor
MKLSLAKKLLLMLRFDRVQLLFKLRKNRKGGKQMKTKKLKKGFALNKETIANLNRDKMAAVRGGEDTCGLSCTCSTQDICIKIVIFFPKESSGGTC